MSQNASSGFWRCQGSHWLGLLRSSKLQLIDFFLYERYKNAFESLIKKTVKRKTWIKIDFVSKWKIASWLVWFGTVWFIPPSDLTFQVSLIWHVRGLCRIVLQALSMVMSHWICNSTNQLIKKGFLHNLLSNRWISMYEGSIWDSFSCPIHWSSHWEHQITWKKSFQNFGFNGWILTYEVCSFSCLIQWWGSVNIHLWHIFC